MKIVMTTGNNTRNPLKKIPQVKDQFDKLESKLFEDRLNRIIIPQGQIDLENKLQKFEEFRMKQNVKRLEAIQTEQVRNNETREERRKVEIGKMSRVMNFNKDWNQTAEQNWKKNMETKLLRDKEEERFRIRQIQKIDYRREEKNTDIKNEMYDELEHFEKRHLEEKETDIEASNADITTDGEPLQRKSQADHAVTHTHLMRRIQDREKEMHSEFFKKERDKRRRKMIVDQSKGQREIEIKRKEAGLLEKMLQESKQEEEIRYEFYRTRKAKELIVENRSLREHLYSARVGLSDQTEEVRLREERREVDMLNHMVNDFQQQVELYLKREKTLRINKDIEKRDTNYSKCRKIVDILLNIADSCYAHNQDADSKNPEDIEPNFWHENLSLLKSETEPFAYRNPRNKIATDVFVQDHHEEEKYRGFLDLELDLYLQSRGQWQVPVTSPKSHEQPVDPKADASEAFRVKIPSSPVNNEYLGNLVAKLIEQKYPSEQKQEEIIYPQYLPIKLCLLGKFYSGKSTVTRYLQNKFNLEIISVEQIVNEAIVRYGNCEDSFDHAEEIEQYNSMQLEHGEKDVHEEDYHSKRFDEDAELRSLENNHDDRYNLSPRDLSQEGNRSADRENNQISLREVQPEDTVVQPSDPPRNPIKSLVRRLFAGEDVSDELYCRIVIDEILHRHKFKQEEEYFAEMKRNREAQIQQEKDRLIKAMEQTHEKVNLVRQRVDLDEKRKEVEVDESKFELIPPSGYVLLDFPNSYRQAKLLEKLMTNFLPRDEIPKNQAQLEKEFLLKLVKPTAKDKVDQRLRLSGFDSVLYLEASNDSCLNRAFGDFKTQRDMHYHLVANPPPVNHDRLVESLLFNENPQKNQYLMADLNKNRSLDLPEMIEFYRNFGTESDKLHSVVKIDANNDMTTLLSEVDEIVSALLKNKNHYYSEFESRIAQREAEREEQMRVEKEQQDKEKEMKLVDPQVLQQALAKAKDSMAQDRLKQETLDLLTDLWKFSSENYVQASQSCFRSLRESREIFAVVLAECQRSFLQHIEADDEKKKWLFEYQSMYNGFLDENPDILEQDHVKEEFHQR